MAQTDQSNEKKAASEARKAVRAYLQWLKDNKTTRGPKRTPETISKRIASIDNELESASVLKALDLSQERINLSAEKTRLEEAGDGSELEAAFIACAKAYGESRDIPIKFAGWREAGVSAVTLKEAGIGRGD